MQWITRDYVHLDRVASPWLIARFVDAQAEFQFVPWGQESERPGGAIPFGIPGVELGPHDAGGTTFEKILRKYELTDPALARMGSVIHRGVDAFFHGTRPAPEETDAQIAIGLLALSEGFTLTARSDAEILALSFPVYDALYANFKVHAEVQTRGLTIPKATQPGPGEKVRFLRGVLASAS